ALPRADGDGVDPPWLPHQQLEPRVQAAEEVMRQAIALLVVGLATSVPAPAHADGAATAPAPAHADGAAPAPPDTMAPAMPGRLIDVGGYRLHLWCMGHGTPTVVIVPGASEHSFNWVLVQPEVAKTTRICSCDRGGE